MSSYLGNNAVKVSVDLTDKDAQKLSYRIVDHKDMELLARTEAEDVSGQDTYEITIPAELNVLEERNQQEVRLVEIYIETSVGVIKTEEYYTIQSDEVLVTGVNSFQSYAGALMTATTLTDLEGWDSASKEDRVKAMIEARRAFGRLKFRYNFDDQSHIIDETVNVSDITRLTPDEFNDLPPEFKDALKRAQVLEANENLTDNDFKDIEKLASLGVTRTEVYEAKVSLGSGKRPYKTTLCVRAMKELTKWLLFRKRLARTA